MEEKIAYLAELRRLLSALPQDEREAALTYYGEYFDDAGAEETERVISELGSARALAEQILSGYSRDYLDATPRSSSAQVPARLEDAAEARRREEEAKRREEEARRQAATAQAEEARRAAPPPRRSTASVILMVLLAILALPMLLAIAAPILGLLIALAAVTFGLGIGAGAAALMVFVAGMVMLTVGFSLLAVHIAEALLAFGVGLALLGLGSILMLVCVFMLVKVMPAVLRFLLRILRWPFERRVARV
jgi:uncharacterized membrane protein